jgi:L-lactate dehydrogenase
MDFENALAKLKQFSEQSQTTSFDIFFNETKDVVYRVAYHYMRCEAESEDILQSVYLKIFTYAQEKPEKIKEIVKIFAAQGVDVAISGTRLEKLQELQSKITSKTIRDVMGNIVEHTKEAIIIVITNPLHTILYIAENEFDYPEGKIFGTGTMLDSARLRNVFANAYDVDPKSVVGYMMGEHGATAFPVLSKLNIQGVAYEELDQYFDRDPQVDLSSPEDIKKNVVSAAYDVFNGKGWTNAGVAQAAVTMAKAVVLDERSVYPACTTLRGEYGYNGNVALSMPCIIGVNGVEKRLPVSLNTWEEEKLHESAAYIQKAMQDADVKF